MKIFLTLLIGLCLAGEVFAGAITAPSAPVNPCCIDLNPPLVNPDGSVTTRVCGAVDSSGVQACLDRLRLAYNVKCGASLFAQGDVGGAGGARDRSACIFGN